jgi:hypothetical protein
MNVGNWVRSFTGKKWHLVESTINDEAITKCGRRWPKRQVDVREEMPLTRMIGQPQLCRYCDRPTEEGS